jgi:phage baseplate assembly protein W
MPTIQGIAYPLAIDPATGGLRVAADAELIRGHILSWLETEPLERVMRPDYGTPDYLFTSQNNWQAIAARIEQRLITVVPQARFSVVGELGEEGEGVLEVFWSYEGIEQDPVRVTVEV